MAARYKALPFKLYQPLLEKHGKQIEMSDVAHLMKIEPTEIGMTYKDNIEWLHEHKGFFQDNVAQAIDTAHKQLPGLLFGDQSEDDLLIMKTIDLSKMFNEDHRLHYQVDTHQPSIFGFMKRCIEKQYYRLLEKVIHENEDFLKKTLIYFVPNAAEILTINDLVGVATSTVPLRN